ncbi:MAG: hypothetical protein J2P18_01355 [Nocardia sp.]|nr:hypothetical protein [Nocardia sp.]
MPTVITKRGREVAVVMPIDALAVPRYGERGRSVTRCEGLDMKVAALIGALALLLLNAACAAPSAHRGPRSSFNLFDNTHYTDVDLGLPKSNILYEQSPIANSVKQGKAPDEQTFKQQVREHNTAPGPFVMDFENLYLKGADAEKHCELLIAMADWAHQAAPGKAIGYYGVLDNVDSQHMYLEKKLAPHEDAYFPTMYTFNDDRAGWTSRLTRDVELAKQVDASKPMYPYVWPQYHEGTPNALRFIDADYWTFQLNTLRKYASRAVIWSSTGPNTSTGWVQATKRFAES